MMSQTKTEKHLPRLELCCECDSQTGRAGRSDDSLYTGDGYGPLCENCWDKLPDEAIRLRADNEKLRDWQRRAVLDLKDWEAELVRSGEHHAAEQVRALYLEAKENQ